jgi:hypothetical protein
MVCIVNLIVGHASIRHYQKKKSEFIIETLEAKLAKKLDTTTTSDTVKKAAPPAGGDGSLEDGNDGVISTTDYGGKSEEQQALLNEGIDKIEEKLIVFKRIHGFSMVLSWIMVLGAGIMFVRRSSNLRNCQDLFAVEEEFRVGATVYEDINGKLIVGFPPEEDL